MNKKCIIKYNMMLERKVNWENKFRCAKKRCFGRVVEGLFLSRAVPKRECLSYLIMIIRKQMSHTYEIALISAKYDIHHLLGPSFIKLKHSTTRSKQALSFAQKFVYLFSSIIKLKVVIPSFYPRQKKMFFPTPRSE